MDREPDKVKGVIVELLEKLGKPKALMDEEDLMEDITLAPSVTVTTLDKQAELPPAFSDPRITAMAEERLHVAGLGHHTVTDDLMFPVLVCGFALIMIVLVLLQRHWKATAMRRKD